MYIHLEKHLISHIRRLTLEQMGKCIGSLTEPFPEEVGYLSASNLPLFLFLRWLTIEPDRDKCPKPTHHAPQACDPDPSTRNAPTPWPLVVCKVSYGDLSLLLDIGQKRSLVVDFECEDAMLVGQRERCAEDGAVRCRAYGMKRQTVEGREHAELELEAVFGGDDEWRVVCRGILREFDVEGLGRMSVDFPRRIRTAVGTYHIILDPVDFWILEANLRAIFALS